MKTRILALSAAAVLALPVLAACGDVDSKKKCKSNAAVVQVFAKPGGGGSNGGSKGGSKSKGNKTKKKPGTGGGAPVTTNSSCKDKKK